MSGLARAHDAVNLGQGFPDFGWPDDVVAKAAEALSGAASQYPPMRGLPELRRGGRRPLPPPSGPRPRPGPGDRHLGRDRGARGDACWRWSRPATRSCSSSRSTTPICRWCCAPAACRGWSGWRRRAGGSPPRRWPRRSRRRPGSSSSTTRTTRPRGCSTPTSSACSPRPASRNDALAVSDEVWEHVVFDGRAHVPLASLPGMAERTVKIGSAGKIFSLTGWKVGWAAAPPPLAAAVAEAHQFLTFTTAPNLQAAVAWGLGKDDAYYAAMRAGFAAARDRMARRALEAAGYRGAALPRAPISSPSTSPGSGIACRRRRLLRARRRRSRRRRDPGLGLLCRGSGQQRRSASASPSSRRRSRRASPALAKARALFAKLGSVQPDRPQGRYAPVS